MIKLRVNNRQIEVEENTSVAAAICIAGLDVLRVLVTGQPRGPLCGMGICFECRVTIDGEPHVRSCNIPVRDGMEVVTDD